MSEQDSFFWSPYSGGGCGGGGGALSQQSGQWRQLYSSRNARLSSVILANDGERIATDW